MTNEVEMGLTNDVERYSGSVSAENGEKGVLEATKAKDAVYAMLGSQLRTTLSDGRVVEGKLQCMDRLINFILADAVETGTAAAAPNGDCNTGKSAPERLEGMGAQQRHLGLVMIPGKHLVSVQLLGSGCESEP